MDYQKYFNKNGCCVGLVNELTTNIQFCARSHANCKVTVLYDRIVVDCTKKYNG